MNNAECPEHPACREGILAKIEEKNSALSCRINKKLGIRTFWLGVSAAISGVGIIAMLSYGAYAGRIERVEKQQQAQAQKVERQAEAIQRIDKTVEKIKTRQEIVIENQSELKNMLETLLRERLNGGNCP